MKSEKYIIEKIINELDKYLLIGAAMDCMSDLEKFTLSKKLENILKIALI